MGLAQLVRANTPYLRPGPPPEHCSGSMKVKVHLSQMQPRWGRRQQQQGSDIATMLFRKGLAEQDGSLWWAALHSHNVSWTVIEVLVKQEEQAQQAARDAVAAKRLTVGPYTVPLSMAPCAGPPAGCVQVTLHQLPLEYVRRGCMQTLLHCAQQPGTVVCEFLGGSSWCGDAALTCPAADTVVAWVQPPPGDLLLTKLPSSFRLQDGTKVLINVDGRPASEPSRWRQLSVLCERQLQQLQRECEGMAAPQAGRQPPPQHQQMQQQQREQTAAEDAAPDAADMDVDGQSAPGHPPQPGIQQRDSTHRRAASDMQLGEDSAGGAGERQQQEQQQQGEGSNSDAAAAAAAARLPPNPFGMQEGDSHSSWVQERVEEMVHFAVEVAAQEGEAAPLTAQCKQQLEQQFAADFAPQLQQQQPPSVWEVEAWVRQQLGLQHTSYGDDSDGEQGEAADDTMPASDQQQQSQQQQHTRQQQQQQHNGRPARRKKQQQQQQQQQPVRRSARAGAGTVGPQYAAVFGTAAQQQRAGLGGRDGQGVGATQQQPATPAAQPPRPGRRGAVT